MKRFLLPLLAVIALPTAVNAEEYICTDVGGEERPTYKRINKNKFTSTITLDGESSTMELSIEKETKNFIVLIQTFDYQDSWTTVLDKKNKEYSGNLYNVGSW